MRVKHVAMGGAIGMPAGRRSDPKIKEVVFMESGRSSILPGQSMRKG